MKYSYSRQLAFKYFCILIISILYLPACTKSDTPPTNIPPIPQIPEFTLPIEGNSYGNCLLVTWKKVAEASNYTLQFSEDEIFSLNGSLILSEKIDSSEQSYIMDFRSKGKGNYYCRIKAGNTTGESTWSSSISYNINYNNLENCIDYTPPLAPSLLLPEDSLRSNEKFITFSWSESFNATHYQISISSMSSSSNQLFYNKGNIQDTQRNVQSFQGGRYYSWSVRAFNHNISSPWAESRIFWVEP